MLSELALRYRALLIALSVLAAPLRAGAETPPAETVPAPAPKIALVLSGGGALGLAHAGVIQELERQGIRPDLVVGTSMGAVIGGLYASGLTGEEIEAIVRRTDWTSLFSAAPPRRDLTYRQKQQQADFPGSASLGVTLAGVLLPAGAVSDQRLMETLRKIVPLHSSEASFDTLPIPFRAVATDIATGKAVALDAGDLPLAMRASMSVPGVFPPVTLDGQLLVDGGLSANVPISVARELGADIVIAAWTPGSLMRQDDIDTAVDVLGQTVKLLILANERVEISGLGEQDILIRIEAGVTGPAAFRKAAEFIAAGRAATRDASAALAAVPKSGAAPARSKAPPPVISFVRIENTSRLGQVLLEERLAGLAGQVADPERIDAAITSVYALGPFERVDYRLATEGGMTGLVITAEDRAPDAGRVRLGLRVEGDFNTESDAAISLDYRTPFLDPYGSDVQVQATLGDFNVLSAEYIRILDADQRWFGLVRTEVQNRPVNLFSPRGFKEAGYDLTYGKLTVAAGHQFGRIGEVRLGLETGYGRAKLNEGIAAAAEIDLDIGRIVLAGGIDTLDDPFFPTHGLRARIVWTQGLPALGENADFSGLSADGLAAFSRGDGTVAISLAGGETFSGTLPIDAVYRIGGLFSLSGYRREELAGDRFAAARLVYRHRLFAGSDALIGVPLFAGGSFEAGDTWRAGETPRLRDLRFGASLFAGADTALGPVYLAFGRSEGGRQSAYLVIGRAF